MTDKKTWRQLIALLRLMGALILVTLVILGGQALLGLWFTNNVIDGTSMEPTLHPGDRVVAVRRASVTRNDIVILHGPDDPDRTYIKRVIGLPGDFVWVKNERLYINGQQVAQPYLKPKFMAASVRLWAKQQHVTTSGHFTDDFTLATLKATHRATVPAGSYFVMGDNRRVSYDSRNFGFVDRAGIIGVVKWRYWPLSKAQTW
ncbi:signal peptidase I [Lacticaseibacillus parakribbianus]|uniref:signal peptidase I n=1 Tax=Lacticaseibacillus parakribbianus TaxID=2970927 RepID=UPI0021CB7EF4